MGNYQVKQVKTNEQGKEEKNPEKDRICFSKKTDMFFEMTFICHEIVLGLIS